MLDDKDVIKEALVRTQRVMMHPVGHAIVVLLEHVNDGKDKNATGIETLAFKYNMHTHEDRTYLQRNYRSADERLMIACGVTIYDQKEKDGKIVVIFGRMEFAQYSSTPGNYNSSSPKHYLATDIFSIVKDIHDFLYLNKRFDE